MQPQIQQQFRILHATCHMDQGKKTNSFNNQVTHKHKKKTEKYKIK